MAFYFKYVAIDKHDNTVKGSIEAVSKKEATLNLKEAGLRVVKIEQAQKRVVLKTKLQDLHEDYIQRVSDYEVIHFTRELSLMLRVGIPVTQSFESLAKYQDNSKFKKVILSLKDQISSGHTLARSIGKHPRVFPSIYQTLTEVGETTGRLAEVLHELSRYQEEEYNVRKKVANALFYPLFVMGFTIVIMTGLMIYYIPSFINFLEGMHVELPASTKILMGIVHFFQNPYSVGLLVFGIVLFFFIYYNYSMTVVGRYNIDRVKLAVPMFGEIIMMVNIARFARTCALMYKCGIGIVRIVDLSRKIVESAPIREMFEDCREQITEGMTLSQAIGANPYVSPLMRSFLILGEETGDIVVSMEKIAEIYDDQVAYKIECLISMIEPVFMGVLAIVVGFIGLSLFLPIYSAISSMGV